MKQEQAYLDSILEDIDLKINQLYDSKIHYEKEIESIGIPDKEDAGLLRKYKEAYRSVDGKVYSLENRKKNTHFGRMDLILTERDVKENLVMYIGEKSYTDLQNKLLIYDWRSPVCNLYYMSNQDQFQYEDSLYQLQLKRQIDIKNQKVQNFYDLYVSGQNVDVTDNFLLKVLEEKKSRNEFSDIIRTIQSNQNNIIRDNLHSHMMVQGVAGSGKTVVLLHRISYLLYNHPNLSNKNIIFITPSKVFANKLFEINRSLELNQIKMMTMEEYYFYKIKALLPGIKLKEVCSDMHSEHALLSFVYQNGISFIKEELQSFLQLHGFSSSIPSDKTIYQFLLDEQKEINKNDWSTLAEKDALENRAKVLSPLLKKDVMKKVMDQIHNSLQSRFYIKSKTWVKSGSISHYQAYLLLTIYQLYGFPYQVDYKYLFIDEMQDYANAEFSLLYTLEKKPYFNLYGDVNQNIKTYIPKKDISDFISFFTEDLKVSQMNPYQLIENYRNSKQVISYCNQFLTTPMVSMGIDSTPVIEKESTKDTVLEEITKTFQGDAVILVNDPHLIEQFRSFNYECYSVLEAKGLEFSKVIVINDKLNLTEQYIAYTRSLDQLYVYKI